MEYQAVVIGASTGGFSAVGELLAVLPRDINVPIIVVQHLSPYSDDYMAQHLNEKCKIRVKEADEKEKLRPGCAYIAPANYHLLIEKDGTLSLTVELKVNYARPSIDVLFESAADAFGDGLIGVVLTGANSDGSKGLKRIKDTGGLAIVQDPASAQVSEMPKAAIKAVQADFILKIEDIGRKIVELLGDINEYKK